MKEIPNTKNLTETAPRSPRVRLGNYVLLARAIDKCRAEIAGINGEYNFDCPLDNHLFSFKEIKGADLKQQVAAGLSDEQLLEWINQNGKQCSEAEVKAWSDAVESDSLYNSPIAEKREFFIAECAKHSLNPEVTSTFTWLEADDCSSFSKACEL